MNTTPIQQSGKGVLNVIVDFPNVTGSTQTYRDLHKFIPNNPWVIYSDQPCLKLYQHCLDCNTKQFEILEDIIKPSFEIQHTHCTSCTTRLSQLPTPQSQKFYNLEKAIIEEITLM